MDKPTVYCLHGFLGLPSDWDFLEEAAYSLEKVKIFNHALPSNGADMADWAKSFNAFVRTHGKTPRALLGYSMGGRLALHCLADDPALWDAAMIVSANPGLSSSMRLAQDEEWARRFESESWEQVITDWNRQPVFAGSAPMLKRLAGDFDRRELAHAIRNWSPSKTRDLSEQITRLKIPVSWVAGALDTKYVEIAQKIAKLSQSPLFETEVLPLSGHRAPWDQPAAFKKYFCGFIERSLLKTGH